MHDKKTANDENSIAVIGMACRFPGARNTTEFWRNIADGIEPIKDLSEEELSRLGLDPALLRQKNYVRRSSSLDDVELFDAGFFDFTAREASMTSPSQRMLLMCAYEALEDACYTPRDYKGSIGVFAGVNRCDEWQKRLYRLAAADAGEFSKQLQLYIASDLDYSATRISYKFNLRGPSFNVSTACSTSLVAIHQACRSLLSYECDMALAGGSSVVVPQDVGYLHEPGGIKSSDGRCRAFDARSDGTIFGNGAGVILLKRLEEAVADRDHIYAVVRGSAVNNDGSAKVGYTAPSVTGQSEVITAALAVADIHPEWIAYVEAHGTGTPLGDPIEIEALTKAFRPHTGKKAFCAIGSVKTNIGHLGAAAGIAGFIKAVQTLEHAQIPPSLHFETPNREINFTASPFFVNTRLTPWKTRKTPRCAAVSSFGVGGTNAHVILQEAPGVMDDSKTRPAQLILLSAKTSSALGAACRNLAHRLGQDPALNLADMAYSLNTGRERMAFRQAHVAGSVASAMDRLTHGATQSHQARSMTDASGKTAFMFPGQGSQYVNMGRGLYQHEGVFRNIVDQCARILQPWIKRDLRELLYAGGAHDSEAEKNMRQTHIAQPALFVMEYAMSGLWQSWGVRPSMMIGHSVGEYVAACLSGVFSLEDALYLVAERGRLMQSMPAGAMLAVPMSEKDLLPLPDGCELAAVNAPEWSVVSGTEDAIHCLGQNLASKGVNCSCLHTSHAFHSAMMDPILGDFLKALKTIKLKKPTVPFISNVTGEWIRDHEATDPAYWVSQLRGTVRFHAGAVRLLSAHPDLLMEVGPGQILTGLVKAILPADSVTQAASSCRQAKQQHDDMEFMLSALGQAWMAGVNIDWNAYYKDEKRRRISLPTYPFEGKRYWLEGEAQAIKLPYPGTSSGSWQSGSGLPEPDPVCETQAPSLSVSLRACSDTARMALLKEFVQQSVHALFGTSDLSDEDALIELGMSSLMAIELRTQINGAIGFDCISVISLLDGDTSINKLALHIAKQYAETSAGVTQQESNKKNATAAVEPVKSNAETLPTDADVWNSVNTHFVIQPDPDGEYDKFPLTDIQQAYWIGRHATSGGDGVATYAYIENDIRNLDMERYERSLNKLISRHNMLRMVVREDGNQQFLRSVPEYKVSFEDISGCAEEEKQKKLDAMRERMSHQVLDPSAWPLFEVRAHKINENVYRLHYGFDFLIVDVLSLLVFFRDLFLMYTGESQRLDPLLINFRDYVLAEKKSRQSQQYAKARDYWLNRVHTLPAAPMLPYTQEPTKIIEPRYVRRDFELDEDTWQRLKDTARRRKLTPSVLIANAFSEILAAWCTSPRFTLNLTIFNRPKLHPQMNDLIGDFTSSVLLEVDMSQRSSFETSAKRLQNQLLNDLEHRQFNGVEVLRSMNSQQGGYQATVMPIVLTSALGLDRHAESRLTGLTAEQLSTYEEMMTLGHTISQTSQVWLDHVVREKNGKLLCNWDALEQLFPGKVLDDMICAYYDRLVQLANEGDAAWQTLRPADLPLYQQQLRDQINQTEAPVCDELLQNLLNRIAREKPQNIAVVNRGVTLTYSDLLVMSSRLGQQLRGRGIKPNQLVAVVMDKGWEQIVAVFGILFSGGAYMPVDAALPKERIRHLLLQGEVSIALTQSHLTGKTDWPEEVDPIEISQQQLLHNRETGAQAVDINAIQKPSDLAYVLFTSGSTGVPKGVMIDHQSVVNTVLDINRRFQVTEQDRALCINALNFDLSVYDIFGLLSAGGALILPDYDRALDPKHWAQLVAQERVTLWNTVPAIVQLYIEELEGTQAGAGSDDNNIKYFFMSGDWIPVGLPDRIRQALPKAKPISLGGPTETTVWSIYYPIESVHADWKSIPYGKPLENRKHLILHADLSPCPDWVTGDLYTGGKIGLSKGYWRDGEKTSQVFIRHPETGERLYRTGDLGRFLPDGNIEFMGRVDNQVKVQGHRIELGEVEFGLRQCDDVQDAVVMALRDDTASKSGVRLVAYVVQEDHTKEDMSIIQAMASSGCLSDHTERAAFKLQQVGVRAVQHEDRLIRLPQRPERKHKLRLSSLSYAALLNNRPPDGPGAALTMEQLGGWLSCLGQVPLPGYPLPKYYYPSAGSAHPVQAYLYLNGEVMENTPAGLYYYDPASHGLVLLDGAMTDGLLTGSGLNGADVMCPKASQFILFLVSYDPAITPLYGKEAGNRFATIEAGHMHYLLASVADESGISLGTVTGADEDKLRRCLKFSDSYRVVQCLRGGAMPETLAVAPRHKNTIALDSIARQSYRRFSREPLSRKALESLLSCCVPVDQGDAYNSDRLPDKIFPDLYLYVKPQRIDDLAGGFHRFDMAHNRLLPVCEVRGGLPGNLQYLENRRVHQHSAFSLIFLSEVTEVTDQPLLAAGFLAQCLLHRSVEWDIGLCSVGGARLELVRQFVPLSADTRIFYCLEGGRIDRSQTEQWVTESMHLDTEQSWKDSLREKLPYYMIPASFVRLKDFPLTPNGKVDRNALKAMSQATPPKHRQQILPEDEVETILFDIWKEVLQQQALSMDDNLFDLGGDSLSATKLISEAGKILGVNVPLHKVFTDPTIAGMAQHYRILLADKNADATADHRVYKSETKKDGLKVAELLLDYGNMSAVLQQDAILESGIRPEPALPVYTDGPSGIFLTGATGFLGAYVLKELLIRTSADIYCLVRAAKSAAALSRVVNNLKRYRLWQEEYLDRLTIVEGDLSGERFDLDDESYGFLCDNVDVVYHLGAQVNYARSYQDLRKTNVQGAKTIIKFACAKRLKSINFISTKYVCFGMDDSGIKVYPQEAPVVDPSGVFIGYTQSKWVSEKLFEQAMQRGVPVAIYRPGQITAALHEHAVCPDDAFHQLVKLFISLESRPDDREWNDGVIDIVPVDFAARAIAVIGSQRTSYGRHYNLVNPSPMPISVFFDLIARRRGADRVGGHGVLAKPFRLWAEDCQDYIAGLENATAAYVLEKFFVKTENGYFIRGLFLNADFSVTNVIAGLRGQGVTCPPVDEDMWNIYFEHLMQDASGRKGVEVEMEKQ